MQLGRFLAAWSSLGLVAVLPMCDAEHWDGSAFGDGGEPGAEAGAGNPSSAGSQNAMPQGDGGHAGKIDHAASKATGSQAQPLGLERLRCEPCPTASNGGCERRS